MRPPSLESGVFISPIDVMTIGGTARPTTRNALVHIQLEETHPTTLNHANQVVSNRFVPFPPTLAPDEAVTARGSSIAVQSFSPSPLPFISRLSILSLRCHLTRRPRGPLSSLVVLTLTP
jgi:hypothetical protein